MITLERFRLLETALRDRGYGEMIEWSETIGPAADADEFAERVIYVICNSGMANIVAGVIYGWCMEARRRGEPAIGVFGHPGKGPAIDRIWQERQALFAGYNAEESVGYLQSLPWIGEVTALHLAKNLDADTHKPDSILEGKLEVGWRIRADKWRRGYGFEATAPVMAWAANHVDDSHM